MKEDIARFFRKDYLKIKRQEAIQRREAMLKQKAEAATNDDDATSEEEESYAESASGYDESDGDESEGDKEEYREDEEIEPGDESIIEEEAEQPQASNQNQDITAVAHDLISAVAQGDVEKVKHLLTFASEASLYRLCESVIRTSRTDAPSYEELALAPLNCWDKDGSQYNVELVYPLYKNRDDMRTHILAVHHCPIEKVISSEKALVNLLQVLCIVCRDPDETRDAMTPNHISFIDRMEMLDMVLDAFKKNEVLVDTWLYNFAYHSVGNRWEFIKRIWYHNIWLFTTHSGKDQEYYLLDTTSYSEKVQKSHLRDIVSEIQNSYAVKPETFAEDYGHLIRFLAHLCKYGNTGIALTS